MKYLRLFIFFILALIVVVVVFSWLVPVKQSLEKSVSIQAPAAVVFEQVARLQNFNQWSAWNQQDSTVKLKYTGTDGSVGASSHWTGDPKISGEGSITIDSLEPGKMVSQRIHFIQPKEGHANSTFTLSELNGLTTISWHFESETPRPWNIFNFFSDIEKNLGPEFEKGLAALKARVEKVTVPSGQSAAYEVKEMDFPETKYALIRQEVKWKDIPVFYAGHISILNAEAQRQQIKPGIATGLYFTWDNRQQLTDMAAAIPLPQGKELGSPIIRMETIKAGKAIYTDHFGAYDKTLAAWTFLRQYIASHNLKEKAPVIEQYLNDPAMVKDTAKWQTRVWMLLE
jgi:effector-binding domain-containing protein